MKLALCVLLLSAVASADPIGPASPGARTRPALGRWANLGGTVIQRASGQSWVVTTNGNLPLGGIVSIRRQGRVVDGGEVISSGTSVAQIRTWGRSDLQPGDWMLLDAVPAPPVEPYNPALSLRPHPTSSAADARYQSWLRRGFTFRQTCYPSHYGSSRW